MQGAQVEQRVDSYETHYSMLRCVLAVSMEVQRGPWMTFQFLTSSIAGSFEGCKQFRLFTEYETGVWDEWGAWMSLRGCGCSFGRWT